MASTLFSSPASSVNDLCKQYDSELSKVVDVHAPLKTRFTSRPSAPWYSEEIAAENNVNVVNWKGSVSRDCAASFRVGG